MRFLEFEIWSFLELVSCILEILFFVLHSLLSCATVLLVMKSLLPYIQIILSVILVILILVQKTGAQVGGAFGGSDNFSSAFHTRRGLEKGLFNITIVIAILFAVSALANLV